MAQAQLMYIATTNGITILSNPGRTDRWLTVGQELAQLLIVSVACDHDDPMHAYAVTETVTYATLDGGQTWHETEQQQPGMVQQEYSFPGKPAAQLRINHSLGTPERSEDHGNTWQPVLTDSGGSWNVFTAPAYHQDTAYAATANGEVWTSTDRGRSWTLIKRDLAPINDLAIGRVIS